MEKKQVQAENKIPTPNPFYFIHCVVAPNFAHNAEGKVNWIIPTRRHFRIVPPLFLVVLHDKAVGKIGDLRGCGCAAAARRFSGGDGRPQNDVVVDFWGPTHVTTTSVDVKGKEETRKSAAPQLEIKPQLGEASQGQLANKVRRAVLCGVRYIINLGNVTVCEHTLIHNHLS